MTSNSAKKAWLRSKDLPPARNLHLRMSTSKFASRERSGVASFFRSRVASAASPPLSSPAPEFLSGGYVRRLYFCLVMLVLSLLSNMVAAQSIDLTVDLTDAPRNIFHSQLTIPVKPGPLTLVYPKWIPGNHRPSGPIANVTGVKMEASGQTLAWQRDPIDMYAFHVEIPAGANELRVSLDTITTDGSAGASGPAATSNVLDLNWNQVVLYPQGASSDEVQVTASVFLPCCGEWKFGTALPRPITKHAGGRQFVHFDQFP